MDELRLSLPLRLQQAQDRTTDAMDHGALPASEVAYLATNTEDLLDPLYRKRPQLMENGGPANEYRWIDFVSEQTIAQFSREVERHSSIVSDSGRLRDWYDALLGLRDQMYRDILVEGAGSLAPYDAKEIGQLVQSARVQTLVQREEQQQREKMERAADGVQEVLKSTQSAAGKASDLVLSSHFDDVAASEKRTATWWRRFSVGSLVAVAALAAIGLLVFPVDNAVDLGRKVAVGVPLLALSAYFGREAASHQRLARRYELSAIQLKTLDSFIAPMAEDARTSMRLTFGDSIFGQAIGRTDSPEPSSAPLSNVAEILRATTGTQPKQQP